MKNFVRFFLTVCVVIALTQFLMDLLIKQYALNLFSSVEKICLFHLILSLGVLTIIYTVHRLRPKYTSFAFLGTAFLRMGTMVAFVLPLAKAVEQTPITDVIFLMVPYFILTTIEAIFTVKLIRNAT
ncbi:conserved membrane hypothetical protein [Capnocytophaga canis]|uniref:hypothetical protein n=2 Tax=Capnocytophaga canis TaxID=1848903 RepID=UPI000589771D|nr:hypothetical protein [Capnocytophaga canis]CEN42908.1 conserved membrane hypothetical protein [Capnocytophaga canis]